MGPRAQADDITTELEPAELARLRDLAAIRGGLRRELYTLAQRPELTWQQLHNRLQSADPPLADRLETERQRRSHPLAGPWVHRYTPLSESDALIRTLIGHTSEITGCALSPDGTSIVSTGQGGALKIWDMSSGTERAALTGHPRRRVNGCAISPDGTWIVSVHDDGFVRIWDMGSGTERATLIHGPPVDTDARPARSPRRRRRRGPRVRDCGISPDGTFIVSASDDGTLKIWDVASGTEQATLTGHTEPIRACAVSPDGTWLASASRDETVKMWDVASGTERATLKPNLHFTSVAISPDGRWIVSAFSSGALIWDVATETLRAHGLNIQGSGHAWSVNECEVSPDGRWIVTASDDNTLKLWDPAEKDVVGVLTADPDNPSSTGSERATLAGHTDSVTACAVSPDGCFIVSASDDLTLKIWDVSDAAEGARVGHTGPVRSCAFSPDGSWVVSASGDETLKIWDVATGAERATLVGPDGSLTAGSHAFVPSATLGDLFGQALTGCAVGPDGTWLVSSSVGGTVKLWDPAAATERATLDRSGGGLHYSSCAVSPDGTWVVSACGSDLAIWDVATRTERYTLSGHTKPIRACAVSPDGRWLATASRDETVKLWDVASGTERATLAGHTDYVQGCAVSPDGAWLATASMDETVKLWDVASLTVRATLIGHTASVTACAISPDERWIVSGSEDGTVKVWDPATGDVRATFVPPGQAITVAFHPSAPTIACGDEGGGVHLAHLVGIRFGSLVVTAVDLGEGLVIRCPHCNVVHTFERKCPHCDEVHDLKKWRGNEILCPNNDCKGPLRVNEFVVERSAT